MNNFSIVKARDSLRQGGMTSPNDSIVDVLYVLKPLPKYELKVGTDINYSQVLNTGISPSVDLTTRNVLEERKTFLPVFQEHLVLSEVQKISVKELQPTKYQLRHP